MAYTPTNANKRSSFGSLLKHKGEVAKAFYMTLSEHPVIYTSYMAVSKSTNQYENENKIGGRGTWSTKTEGADFTYGDMAQGTEITYTHLTYTDAFDVTVEMAEDNVFSGILSSAREMAKGGNTIMESTATTVLDNAFTSGTGADGTYLCNSAHNLINSASTGDNALTDVLDSDGLDAARVLSRGIVDESNQLVNVTFDTLVVPAALETVAEQLVGSEKTPEDGSNAKNVFSGKFRVVVNPYLASDTAWFLVASGNTNELKPRMYIRKSAEFTDKIDPHSGNFLFQARERFSVGHTSWQHILGSTGAGA